MTFPTNRFDPEQTNQVLKFDQQIIPVVCLPSDIIKDIFNRLTLPNKANASCVCKQWNCIVKEMLSSSTRLIVRLLRPGSLLTEEVESSIMHLSCSKSHIVYTRYTNSPTFNCPRTNVTLHSIADTTERFYEYRTHQSPFLHFTNKYLLIGEKFDTDRGYTDTSSDILSFHTIPLTVDAKEEYEFDRIVKEFPHQSAANFYALNDAKNLIATFAVSTAQQKTITVINLSSLSLKNFDITESSYDLKCMGISFSDHKLIIGFLSFDQDKTVSSIVRSYDSQTGDILCSKTVSSDYKITSWKLASNTERIIITINHKILILGAKSLEIEHKLDRIPQENDVLTTDFFIKDLVVRNNHALCLLSSNTLSILDLQGGLSKKIIRATVMASECNYLFTSFCSEKLIQVWDLTNLTLLHTFNTKEGVAKLTLSFNTDEDEACLAAATSNGRIEIWNNKSHPKATTESTISKWYKGFYNAWGIFFSKQDFTKP
ncbi:MAG: hypothetical protein K0S74_638 [Chlamydiales bacterium]|jgi:WD40 repeat protein|nr:hypothetical protein [Chlamydiales bacterium]